MADLEKDTGRYFLGPDEKTKYFIETPTAEDVRGADWQYSKIYTQCLIEGITTSAEMMDILTRRGIIGPEFEMRANELAEALATKIAALDTAEDMDTKRELSLEVAKAREDLFQWNQRLNGPMNNTAEQMSDDARLEYLTAMIVVDEKGNKVWDSYDSFLKEKSRSLALRARFEVMLFLQGLDSDFLDQTPEAQAMREVQQELLEKAEAAMQAAEAIVIEEEVENTDTIAEEPKKKKTTRKKRASKKTNKE